MNRKPKQTTHVADLQITSELRTIQNAAANIHKRVQLFGAASATVTLSLAGLGVVATYNPNLGTPLAVLGVSWTIVYAMVMRPLVILQLRKAVIAQEMFDTAAFRLPWSEGIAGSPLPFEDVQQEARRLKDRSARASAIADGWYADTRQFSYPMDVLVSQIQNLGWDIRLRRRYCVCLLASATTWILAGIAVGTAKAVGPGQLIMLWYIPSIAAITFSVETGVTQLQIMKEKQRLYNLAVRVIRGRRVTMSQRDVDRMQTAAREIQDGLLAQRLIAPRVPYVLYALFRAKDERDFAEAAVTMRAAIR